MENKELIYKIWKLVGDHFEFKCEDVNPPPPIPLPTPIPLPIPMPIITEKLIGYWMDTEKMLVLYLINGEYWLMQRDAESSYYIFRGKNLFHDSRTIIANNDFEIYDIANWDSKEGGLYKPENAPEEEFLRLTGRVKNSKGEYVIKSSGGGSEDGKKLKQPIGVIRWDGYFTTMVPDDPIDVTKETRYALSDERTKDQGPFYSEFTDPEWINKQKWNYDKKVWEWDRVLANIKFNGDRVGIIEKEIDYAVSAGIDYFLFNYYTSDTPMSIARRQFVGLKDKKGLKAAYIVENIGGHPDVEANLIANALKQDWYQKIDGKPILVLPAEGSHDFDRVYDIFIKIKSLYGGEIYTILQMMGYPIELAGEVRKRGYNSYSYYSMWGGWNEGDRSHRYIMNKEKQFREDAKKETTDFTPNLTVSFYQVGAQKSWGKNPDSVYSEKATDFEFEEQVVDLVNYCEGNDQVKTVYVYSWNEFTEGGRTVCPQLRRDGIVDDRILNILGQHLNK